jgi:hypothetical protein
VLSVRSTRNRGGGGLDQELELFAGDVRIYPVAKGLVLPLEPGLESFCVQIGRREPVEVTEELRPGSEHEGIERPPAGR